MSLRVVILFLTALILPGYAQFPPPGGGFGFTYSVDCPTISVGPISILGIGAYSSAISMGPGSTLTTALFPTNPLTRVDNNAAAPGTYTGTMSCTFVIDGVPINYTRSLSLAIASGTGTLTTGAVSFAVNLGAKGTFNFSAPVETTYAYSSSLVNGGLIVVPASANTTIQNTPASLPGVPAPPSLVLSLTGLAGLGLYEATRRWRKVPSAQ